MNESQDVTWITAKITTGGELKVVIVMAMPKLARRNLVAIIAVKHVARRHQ